MLLRMKNFNMGVNWKIRFLFFSWGGGEGGGGRVHEKPIYRAELPKKREVDAPMHTMDT